jgi:hypothetical protein
VLGHDVQPGSVKHQEGFEEKLLASHFSSPSRTTKAVRIESSVQIELKIGQRPQHAGLSLSCIFRLPRSKDTTS